LQRSASVGVMSATHQRFSGRCYRRCPGAAAKAGTYYTALHANVILNAQVARCPRPAATPSPHRRGENPAPLEHHLVVGRDGKPVC